MRQAAGGDVNVDTLINGNLGVVLTPIASVNAHHFRQCADSDGDPLQHGLQMLHVRRLLADGKRHDDLVVAVNLYLAVVALQIGATGLQEMAAWISEVALGLGRWCTIGFYRRATERHRMRRQGLLNWWLKAGVLGRLDRLLSCNSESGRCRLGFPPQLSLLG